MSVKFRRAKEKDIFLQSESSTICSQDMKHFSLVILLVNALCAFSQITHEISYIVGCFENGTTEAQYEFDGEELVYVDFERQDIVYTVPRFIVNDPSTLFEGMALYNNGKKNKRACLVVLGLSVLEEKHPPEEKDAPDSVLFPADEVQVGVANSLTCFVNHFYPPDIEVSWTKNDRPVSEGVTLSRYYPNKDQTFYQFSTPTFTPMEGDIYSCTVNHSALDRPLTKIWEPELIHPSIGPDIFCGVGLTLGLLGVATGTFLMVKGHHGH